MLVCKSVVEETRISPGVKLPAHAEGEVVANHTIAIPISGFQRFLGSVVTVMPHFFKLSGSELSMPGPVYGLSVDAPAIRLHRPHRPMITIAAGPKVTLCHLAANPLGPRMTDARHVVPNRPRS
jgi:hypothetical protein